MIAPEYFNNHIAVEGEIIVKRVPNDTGSVLVWNPITKKISIRTHAEIVADLNLVTTNTLALYHKRDPASALNNASDTHTNQTWFDYNWAGSGSSGSVANFSGFNGAYSTELFGSYNDPNRISIRTRQGDANTWNEPRWLWHDKNFNPANYQPVGDYATIAQLNNKVTNEDSVRGVAFDSGSATGVPYFIHTNGTYVPMATQSWVTSKGYLTSTNLIGYATEIYVNNNFIPTTQKAQPNGVATLDSSGLVPATQLPSYVDDVLEFANLASFPTTGESGKIYVAVDTNQTYRWSGSTYIQIASGAVQSVNGQTGIVNLTKSDIGLGNVDNTADAIKNVLSAVNIKSTLINLTQLNSFDLEAGMYRIEDVDIGHGGSFYNHIIQTGKYSGGGHICQIAIPFEGNNSMFLRVSDYNGFGSWERIAKNSDIATAISSLSGIYELAFTKNTAFNKNFGTTAGTVAEGNDSRINNGQSAFDYGNHKAINQNQWLGSDYASGYEKPNSTYFGSGKLKLQMLHGNNVGAPDSWYDVFWMSSYTGGDVKKSTAIISSKYTNEIGFAKQDYDSANWGTYFKFWTSDNLNLANFVTVGQIANYVSKDGDVLNGGGAIGSNGDLTLQQGSVGGNATGLFWDSIDNTQRIAGIGVLTVDGNLNYAYMGWGGSPWDIATSLSVSNDILKYKGNNIWHEGNLNPSNYYKNFSGNLTNQSELIPNGSQFISVGNSGSDFDGELSNKTIEGTFTNFNAYSETDKNLGFTLFARTSTGQGMYYKTWYGGTQQEWRRLIDSVDLQNYATLAQLDNYLPLTGGTVNGSVNINGRLSVTSSSMVGYFRGVSPTGNYMTWMKYDNSQAIAYIGADNDSAGPGGVGNNFVIRNPIGDIQLYSDGGIITYNGSEVATKNFLSGNYALRDGSNATQNWINTANGLQANPTIAGKMFNASGQSNLIDATYGEVAGYINNPGIVAGNPTDDWHYRMKFLHGNSAGYNGQIAVQMTGGNAFRYKRVEQGTDFGWIKVWDEQNLPDYRLYGLGRTIEESTNYNIDTILNTSILGINDNTTGNVPFDYGSVWHHRKSSTEFTQFAVDILNGNSYSRGFNAGFGDTGWKKNWNTSDFSYTDIGNWSDKFKTLRNVANVNDVSESGIYRQEDPTSGYPYTTTLNLNSSDGRQQLTIEREGGGMKFRGSNIGSGSAGWSTWKTVWNDSNLVNPATETWVNTNFIPKSHPVYNITQANINSWNAAAGGSSHTHSNLFYLDNIDQYLGTGQAPQFGSIRLMDSLGYGLLALEEGFIGGEIGLVDISNKRFYAGRINEYLKYGSSIDGFEGLNIYFDAQLLSIGREIGNGEDKVQLAGDLSVDTVDINHNSRQLILNPLYNTDGDAHYSRHAHIYIVTRNTVRLPDKPILGQRIEIFNDSDSDIEVTHGNVGTMFYVPRFCKVTGIVANKGFRFDAEPILTKQYDI